MIADRILDDAIAYAAEEWSRFEATVPDNLALRDKVTFFAARARPALVERFPELRAANEQVMLLVLTKGIERSGRVPRYRLERELGIVLPP